MKLDWQWNTQSPAYVNFGNANQWTVNAGMSSLARETAQNSNDARVESMPSIDYKFNLLSGHSRDEFLRALRWDDQLKPHLQGMALQSGGAVAAGNIKTGLDNLDQASSILLLSISDYGCAGLTGPEMADGDSTDFGNFVKLCRADLFSGKDEAAGGSFGLGKAVYWRFSSIQTVLFNSVPSIAAPGQMQGDNRLFGVNQGVAHRVGPRAFEGRGHFGLQGSDGNIVSTPTNQSLADSLYLTRRDGRPGTTVLMVGFYDPDDPESSLGGLEGATAMATTLREGIEENFWPLLTRKRMDVSITVSENGLLRSSVNVDPEEKYTELVRALRRFDSGDLDATLGEPFSVVSRKIDIRIPARKTGSAHGTFTHSAALVVTVSDDQPDSLENKVCLVRRPEMVVETIDRVFEDVTYHAFLLAGAAVAPSSPSDQDIQADDFLRFAEPPAHDRWIPRSGRGKASQSSLNAHYMPPWVPNLKSIEGAVKDALYEIFGSPPPVDGKPVEAIFKNLKFLSGDPGRGPSGTTVTAKPTVAVSSWKIKEGQWHISGRIRARRQQKDRHVTPVLHFVGLDGKKVEVDWESISSPDVEIVDGALVLPGKDRGRFVSGTFEGVSIKDLPIPPAEAILAVEARDVTGSHVVVS